MADSNVSKYPYHGHDAGLVVTQPQPGKFVERQMTHAELATRDVALSIAEHIYEHANLAGFAYIRIFDEIVPAMQVAVAQSIAGVKHEAGLVCLEYDKVEAQCNEMKARIAQLEAENQLLRMAVEKFRSIPVEERLPTHIYTVFIYVIDEIHDNHWNVGIYNPQHQHWQAFDGQVGGDLIVKVSHWIDQPDFPLPVNQ